MGRASSVFTIAKKIVFENFMLCRKFPDVRASFHIFIPFFSFNSHRKGDIPIQLGVWEYSGLDLHHIVKLVQFRNHSSSQIFKIFQLQRNSHKKRQLQRWPSVFSVMYVISKLLKCPFVMCRDRSNTTVSFCAVISFQRQCHFQFKICQFNTQRGHGNSSKADLSAFWNDSKFFSYDLPQCPVFSILSPSSFMQLHAFVLLAFHNGQQECTVTGCYNF